MYAIIADGGRQYKVEQGQELEIDYRDVSKGDELTFDQVLAISDDIGIKLGKPNGDDMIGVWGQSPTSPRGEAVARHTDAPILRVEDAFLRSIHPGRPG